MSTKVRSDAIMIWVCQCCMLVDANGECCELDENGNSDHGGDGINPWSDVDQSKFEITMGLLAEEHHDTCEVYKTGSWPANYECDCERREFTWSSCDGCGSSLAGERHAFALWQRES